MQEHFGCDDVPGAEVEDDGGAGTAGGHWEERIFAVRTANSHPTFTAHIVLVRLLSSSQRSRAVQYQASKGVNTCVCICMSCMHAGGANGRGTGSEVQAL